MARTLRTVIRETIEVARIADASEDFIGDQVPRIPALDTVWDSGTTADKADLVAADFALSIAGSATADLDLDSLDKGPEGSTVSFAEVRAIIIRARSTNGDNVRLEPGASNGWTALGASLQYELPPGSYFRHYCGTDGALPVGASDKVLSIENLDASAAIVDITILGVSA